MDDYSKAAEVDTEISLASTIRNLLGAKLKGNPDVVALLAPGRFPLSYRKLRAQIDLTIHQINGFGLGRGDRIALVLPNGPEMAVAFLAIAAGATAAPLNPAYRAHEFEFYLTDLGARALMVAAGSDSPARAVAQTLGIPVLELRPHLDREAGLFTVAGDVSGDPLNPGFAQPHDVALVLHTSGTTARPKLVPLTQTNLCASAGHIQRTLCLQSEDRCLNVMPLFHIHGLVGALLASLAAGGSVVCTSDFDVTNFFMWFDKFHPTWYSAVPTIHQGVLASAVHNREVVARCPLRFIRSSSSALPPTVMRDLELAFGVPVLESYGMTEAAHQMCSNPLPPRVRKPGSVGLAAGPEVAVMDGEGKPLPPGMVGEVVIRGRNVMASYENNAAANEAAFLNGWFRTGDQGRMDQDGYLYLTGRIKEIINRGGEKIAPREIDDVLMEHPAVAQALTFAVPHFTLGEDIAAAIVLHAETSLNEEELREFAFSRLAHYKIPSRILFVQEIPKGPTGKLQRMGLHEKLAPFMQAEFVAARTAEEKKLADIWIDVLKVPKVGVHDNFFYLGGNSLLATQLVSRARNAFVIELPLPTIFRKPTLAGQALLIGELLAQATQRQEEAMANIIAELENISETEAERLLSRESRSEDLF